MKSVEQQTTDLAKKVSPPVNNPSHRVSDGRRGRQIPILRKSDSGDMPLSLIRFCERGRGFFAARGLPDQSEEVFRYNPFGALRDVQVLAASQATQPMSRIEDSETLILGGRDIAVIGELPVGVTVHTLERETPAPFGQSIERVLGSMVAPQTHVMTALAAACTSAVAVIRVDPGAQAHMRVYHAGAMDPDLAEPHLAQVCATRLLVLMGKKSRLTLEQHYPKDSTDSDDGALLDLEKEHLCLRLPVLEASLADDAVLTVLGIQQERAAIIHHEMTGVHLANRAQFRSLKVQTGAAMGRQETTVTLGGAEAGAHLHSAAVVGAGQVMDTHNLVVHAAPEGQSRQIHTGAVEDHGSGVFRGKVHVQQAAQKTDGYQQSRGLMLGPLAQIDHKPELEIYADDVKCSHGSAITSFDENPLFYLRARGLCEQVAMRLLLAAELEAVLDLPGLKRSERRKFERHLGWRVGLARLC